jgi:hypothetical protein
VKERNSLHKSRAEIGSKDASGVQSLLSLLWSRLLSLGPSLTDPLSELDLVVLASVLRLRPSVALLPLPDRSSKVVSSEPRGFRAALFPDLPLAPISELSADIVPFEGVKVLVRRDMRALEVARVVVVRFVDLPEAVEAGDWLKRSTEMDCGRERMVEKPIASRSGTLRHQELSSKATSSLYCHCACSCGHRKACCAKRSHTLGIHALSVAHTVDPSTTPSPFAHPDSLQSQMNGASHRQSHGFQVPRGAG